MAHIEEIEQNTPDSNQSDPGYVLTFTRWSNRDTFNYKKTPTLEVRRPLVVVNDATSVVVQCSKDNHSPSMSCVLKAGDLNYLTAIAPGDFVIVNLVNWKTKAMEIRARAIKSQPINRHDDGFKGIFKIKDVRMSLKVTPDGKKHYSFTVTAFGFDEFNALLYFNPALVGKAAKASPLFFLRSFGEDFNNILTKLETNNVQFLLKRIIKSAIGEGTKKIVKDGQKSSPEKIPKYELPPQLGELLKRKGSKLYASDINNYYLGIWDSSSQSKIMSNGFNSFFKKDEGDNFFKTTKELAGSRQIAVQDFQNVQVWSLLKNFSNTVINEMYTTYRIAADGHVYPSVIFRQKPFSTEHFKPTNKKYKEVASHTKFLELPRWRISSDMITGIDLGRSDSARINYVQVFTRALSVDKNLNQAAQIALGNSVYDEKDIIRSGMKPYIVSCNFDYPGAVSPYQGQKWADLVGDWVLEGHLKMNGTIQSIGIEKPITVGDNLQLNNTVFHIETVKHVMTMASDGKNTFRTSVTLSMGVDVRTHEKETPVYTEMDYTDSFSNRKDDFKSKDPILPGFSDTQDLPGRTVGEEKTEQENTEVSFTDPTAKPKKKK